MNLRPVEQALIAGALVYLVGLSWAMTNLSFDIWGALVVAPVLLIVGMLGVRRMFQGDLKPLQRVMWLGLAAKLAGALVRYWVAFDAYGGATDAERYHKYAQAAAGQVWAGDAAFSTVLPSGSGTPCMERFTSLVYTVMGSSKLTGFLFFSWLAFWGLAWFVRAACLAIPALKRRRYAVRELRRRQHQTNNPLAWPERNSSPTDKARALRGGHSFDVGAQCGQATDEVVVAAVDVVHAGD